VGSEAGPCRDSNSSRPDRFTLGLSIPSYSMDRRLSGPQRLQGRYEQSALAGMRTPAVTRLYTD
jgi:hypothetical protein